MTSLDDNEMSACIAIDCVYFGLALVDLTLILRTMPLALWKRDDFFLLMNNSKVHAIAHLIPTALLPATTRYLSTTRGKQTCSGGTNAVITIAVTWPSLSRYHTAYCSNVIVVHNPFTVDGQYASVTWSVCYEKHSVRVGADMPALTIPNIKNQWSSKRKFIFE